MLENMKDMALEEEELSEVSGGTGFVRALQVGEASSQKIEEAIQRGNARGNQKLLGDLDPTINQNGMQMSGGKMPGTGVC